MQTVKRMAVWTVKKRIAQLGEFRDLLCEYYANLGYDGLGVQRHPNRRGDAVRSVVNTRLAGVRAALAAVGCDTVVTVYDPPAVGGRERTLELFGNLFSEAVYDHARTPVDVLETAIGTYTDELPAAWARTLNPLHWLNELVLYIVTAPLRFLACLGVPKKLAESSWIAKLYVGLLQMATWAVIVMSVLQGFGYWQAARAWIQHLGR